MHQEWATLPLKVAQSFTFRVCDFVQALGLGLVRFVFDANQVICLKLFRSCCSGLALGKEHPMLLEDRTGRLMGSYKQRYRT